MAEGTGVIAASPPEPGRAHRMAERVKRTARERGFSPDAVAMLGQVHSAAMAPRVIALEDDHDPRFLHPGRVAAILMDDLECGDPELVALGMVFDSQEPRLQAPDEALPGPLAERRGGLPRPEAGETLVEELVGLEAALLDLVLAERLDHLRHLHLLDDREAAAALYRQAARSYSPSAARAHPVLRRRYDWWTRKFGRLFAT